MKKIFERVKYLGLPLMFLAGWAFSQAITDPAYQIWKIDWMLNGASQFVQLVNSSAQLVIRENATLNAAVLTIDDASGAVLLRTRTSAQIQSLASPGAGALVVNSSIPALCISTGTGAGSYVMIHSTTTAAGFGGVTLACY